MDKLEKIIDNIIGDVLVSSAGIAYLGPFTVSAVLCVNLVLAVYLHQILPVWGLVEQGDVVAQLVELAPVSPGFLLLSAQHRVG